MASNDKLGGRSRRKKSIRGRVNGVSSRPRLTVFRSNKHIYAQVVDDGTSQSLASASTKTAALAAELDKAESKVERAIIVGRAIAESCKSAGIEQVVFDRNGYLYHGRVKALADSAREAGLQF